MRLNKSLYSLMGLLFFVIFSTEAIAEKSYRVRSADNINSIVERFYPDRRLSKAQVMVGILVENPKAFKDRNINYLMRGRRLKLPVESKLSNITHENAQELLSQHAFYFREGVTGVEYLLPPVLGGYTQKDSVDASVVKDAPSQDEQLIKISKLEKESETLKKKLENLSEEKKNRDKKLHELEDLINSSQQNQGNDSKGSSQVISKNIELEETNSLLRKQLQKSRSELAENTRSNISLEHQASDLKDNANEDSKTKILKKSEPTEAQKGSWDKLIWILPVLLIGVIWFLFRRKSKVLSEDNDYASQIAEAESLSSLQEDVYIDSEEEEDSLEASIKLDVSRAYVEADETDSALDILREVMEEGNDEQREEAQKILADLS